MNKLKGSGSRNVHLPDHDMFPSSLQGTEVWPSDETQSNHEQGHRYPSENGFVPTVSGVLILFAGSRAHSIDPVKSKQNRSEQQRIA